MSKLVLRFLKDNSGGAIEYGLIAVGIAVAIIDAIIKTGIATNTQYK